MKEIKSVIVIEKSEGSLIKNPHPYLEKIRFDLKKVWPIEKFWPILILERFTRIIENSGQELDKNVAYQ